MLNNLRETAATFCSSHKGMTAHLLRLRLSPFTVNLILQLLTSIDDCS